MVCRSPTSSTTLTFLARRLLLADGDRTSNSAYALALQFLDYPLLVLQAASAAAEDIVVLEAGKRCALDNDDSEEAILLAQQVPCSLLLLRQDISGNTCLVAAGAVHVHVQQDLQGDSSSVHAHQAVILHDQQQQPVACAEVCVQLSTAHSSSNTEQPKPAALKKQQHQQQPCNGTAKHNRSMQDSQRAADALQAALLQLQQAQWPTAAGCPTSSCQHGSCQGVQQQQQQQPCAGISASRQSVSWAPEHRVHLSQAQACVQQMRQEELRPGAVGQMSPVQDSLFPVALQHKQLVPGHSQHTGWHALEQQQEAKVLLSPDGLEWDLRSPGDNSHSCPSQQQLPKQQQQVAFANCQQQQDSPQRDQRQPALPTGNSSPPKAAKQGSSRYGSPSRTPQSKLAAAKAAAAARLQQQQQQLFELKARAASRHHHQQQQPRQSPLRGQRRSQQPLVTHTNSSSPRLSQPDGSVSARLQQSEAVSTPAAAMAAANALHLLAGRSQQQSAGHQLQQQAPMHADPTTCLAAQHGVHQRVPTQPCEGAEKAACAADEAPCRCFHAHPGIGQQQPQTHQAGSWHCPCKSCGRGVAGCACCCRAGQHQEHHCHQQPQALGYTPCPQQHQCCKQHHQLQDQQQQEQQQRWRGGISAATSVVWEFLTLMSVRAVMSQAVNALTDQLSGAVKTVAQQACMQQLQQLHASGAGMAHHVGAPSRMSTGPPAAPDPAAPTAAGTGAVAPGPACWAPAGWPMVMPPWAAQGAGGMWQPWWAAAPGAGGQWPAAAPGGAAADGGAATATGGGGVQQQPPQEGQLTAEQLQAQQEELLQQFQELEGVMVIRAQHSSSSGSSSSGGSSSGRSSIGGSGGSSSRQRSCHASAAADAVNSLAAGMVVKLKRTSGRSSGASGQVSATKGPGDTDDTAPHTAQGGDDDAAEQLMGGKPISGLAGLRPELPAVSAFAAAPSPGPSRSSSRPQSPQAQPNPLSSLLKKLSSMMPEHLPPLPRAPSGNSASRGAAAAAAGTGAGAAAVSGAVHAAAPRATWQVLGSRSNSGVLQQQPRGSVGLLATGAGVAQAGGASAGAAAGGLESIMPATFRSSLRPLHHVSSMASDIYEDHFEAATSTAPTSPASRPSPPHSPAAAAALAAAAAASALPALTGATGTQARHMLPAPHGATSRQLQPLSLPAAVPAAGAGGQSSQAYQRGHQRPQPFAAAGASADHELPEAVVEEEVEQFAAGAEQSLSDRSPSDHFCNRCLAGPALEASSVSTESGASAGSLTHAHQAARPATSQPRPWQQALKADLHRPADASNTAAAAMQPRPLRPRGSDSFRTSGLGSDSFVFTSAEGIGSEASAASSEGVGRGMARLAPSVAVPAQRGQQQQQQQVLAQQDSNSSSASLGSDLSELLAELSANRKAAVGAYRPTVTHSGTAAAAAETVAAGRQQQAAAAAAAGSGRALGVCASGRRGSLGIVGRLSNYSDVSLFSDADEAVPAGTSIAQPTAQTAAAAGVRIGISAATANTASAAAGGGGHHYHGGGGQQRSARISGDSRYSSFSLDDNEIEIDYDGLASLGITMDAPAAAPTGSLQQQQQQQHRPVSAAAVPGRAASQSAGPALQRPTNSYGLPPKPQQLTHQQQQQGLPRHLAGPAPTGGFATQLGAPASAARASAADVFYSHVSGAPMSISSVSRDMSRGF